MDLVSLGMVTVVCSGIGQLIVSKCSANETVFAIRDVKFQRRRRMLVVGDESRYGKVRSCWTRSPQAEADVDDDVDGDVENGTVAKRNRDEMMRTSWNC